MTSSALVFLRLYDFAFSVLIAFQCDQLDPSCSQCKRAGKKCSGYRDQLALLFRDENEKVVQKARSPSTVIDKRKRPRKTDKSSKSTPSSSGSLSPGFIEAQTNAKVADSTRGSEISLIPRASTVIPSVPLSFDDLGINFFFTHYVTVAPNFGPGGIELASRPIWSSLLVNKTFHDAVSSVGFAGLANVTKDRKHMIVAGNKYATTLGRINTALRDPDNNDLADTFKAVMLLTAYEVRHS